MTSIQTEDRTMTAAVEAPLRGQRPSTQYWDHRAAGWRATSPIPIPRRGDRATG
jgi:hypothetical protein